MRYASTPAEIAILSTAAFIAAGWLMAASIALASKALHKWKERRK